MKTINIRYFIIVALCAVFSFANAQTVEEIIAKHIEAHGGETAWNAVKSLKITGRFTAFSVEEDFYAIKTANGSYFSELHLGQHKVIEAFNGKTGWTIDPWQEILYPRELNKTETNVFLQKAEFFTPFYHYKEKGYQVELLGKQDLEGVEVFAIKLTKPNEKTETWYLNASTFLEYKYESAWVDFAYPAPAQTYFDDFRNVDGLLIPFYVEREFWQRNRMLIIENVEINPEIDEHIFEMPPSEEIGKLSFLLGDWDVKVEALGRRGWMPVDQTTSHIEFAELNRIQENITYENTFVQAKTIDYTYNLSTKKYRVSMYNAFSSEIDLLEGNFTDSTFVLENKHIHFGDSIPNAIYTQITYSRMETDSFLVDMKYSYDQGENWNPGERLVYTRRKE